MIVVVYDSRETKIPRGRVTVAASSVDLEDPIVAVVFLVVVVRFFRVTGIQGASVIRDDDGSGLIRDTGSGSVCGG